MQAGVNSTSDNQKLLLERLLLAEKLSEFDYISIMKPNILTPRKALNKAFLKVKPNRNDIETFKGNLSNLLNQINEVESEEFHKNILSKFLCDTY